MQGLTADLIRGAWYLAAPSAQVKAGKLLAKTICGEPVLLARGNDGIAYALKDICPHRGIPLRYGSVVGDSVQCCYHGWQFDKTGTCVHIPSMREGQEIDLSKIRCGQYHLIEQYGCLWAYIPRESEAPADSRMPEPISLPGIDKTTKPAAAIMLPFPCSTDHAAFGLMDPTHAAFVHTSWWFKKNATKLRAKEKHFEPAPLGWRMKRHRLPPQNVAYKVLGKNVETEISYALPGYRIEEIASDTHTVIGLTAITPVNDGETEVHQLFWSTIGWLRPLRPLAHHLMTTFLDQDRQVVIQQREGLEFQPKLMLINDADTQARWWMRLKAEWLAAIIDDRPFVNPLKEQTLRWRS